jgi:hypothetical protein
MLLQQAELEFPVSEAPVVGQRLPRGENAKAKIG